MYYYIAVQCRKNSFHLTPIREAKLIAPNTIKVDLCVQVPFEVVCKTCGSPQQFHGLPVTVIQEEQPIENLPELPEFRESSPDEFLPRKIVS